MAVPVDPPNKQGLPDGERDLAVLALAASSREVRKRGYSATALQMNGPVATQLRSRHVGFIEPP